MAFLHCEFFSKVLQIATSMNVILPENGNKKHPTLLLIHGLSGDHSAWTRQTSIERYVEEKGLAVIMPEVHRSFYTDMVNGYDYWKFISEEVLEVARSFFPLSHKREENFVAGLSMGGYGALKVGLRCNDKFAAAASLSGSVNIAKLDKITREYVGHISYDEAKRIFGEKIEGTENDLFHLIERVSKERLKPKIYQCCGTEDYLYEDNILLKEYIKKFDFDYRYTEEAGAHTWDYWDKKIQDVLDWLPLK